MKAGIARHELRWQSRLWGVCRGVSPRILCTGLPSGTELPAKTKWWHKPPRDFWAAPRPGRGAAVEGADTERCVTSLGFGGLEKIQEDGSGGSGRHRELMRLPRPH